MSDLERRIRGAWQGRISGCQLGKPVELLSMFEGHDALTEYLGAVNTLPLRDYVGFKDRPHIQKQSCREFLTRSQPDDDIDYSVLALLMLEQYGLALSTEDVARTWLRMLPAGRTFTAERAAYRTLLARANERFADGGAAGFDVSECADNKYNEWIGAQIRADVYGWVLPGHTSLAAELARRDATLSHRGDGVHGAAFIAALGAALAVLAPEEALLLALAQIPQDSGAHEAAKFGRSLAGDANGDAKIRDRYAALSPVHTLNNLALVIWSLYSHLDDFGAAIGDVVAAGLDTDCNGATVGALWGLTGGTIPAAWTKPWDGRVGVTLAGLNEIPLETLVARTVAVAERFTKT